MNQPVVTTVDVKLPEGRDAELIAGYRELNAGAKPPGLLRTELLRSFDGTWRIQSTWRDREALTALRQSGEPPAALALVERLGGEHSHAVFTVEESFEADAAEG